MGGGEQLRLGLDAPAPDAARSWTSLKGRVPFAFAFGSSGRSVHAPVEPHESKHRLDYACPVCGAHVRRKGRDFVAGRAVKLDSGRAAPRPHFAHVANAEVCPTGGKHFAHAIAKLYVYLAVHRWLRRQEDPPRIALPLERGHGPVEVAIPDDTADVVVKDHSVLERGTVRPDVVLRDSDGRPVLGIAILPEHTPPPGDGDGFDSGDFWVVEIRAEAILSGGVWPATRSWHHVCPP